MIKNRKEAEAIVANLEIVKAFAEGKAIEIRPYGDCPWRDVDELDLTLGAVDWRVKPGLRPYTAAEAMETIGKKVVDRADVTYVIQSAGRSVSGGDFIILAQRFELCNTAKVNLAELLSFYTFSDGSRCGMEIKD